MGGKSKTYGFVRRWCGCCCGLRKRSGVVGREGWLHVAIYRNIYKNVHILQIATPIR